MALLQLPQKRSDGIQFLDKRETLYYGKHQYRARLHCPGITLAWFCKTDTDVDDRLKKSHKGRWKNVNPAIVKEFVKWRANHATGKDKNALVRIEGNVAAVFSNDLDLLKTLESISPDVDFTEIDSTHTMGVKYFAKEPKHKFRFYLRTKRLTDDFHDRLKEFIKRYENSDSKLVASPSLKQWLAIESGGQYWNTWRIQWCSSHFFIDYDEESVITLFGLMFNNMIGRRFKLEKVT